MTQKKWFERTLFWVVLNTSIYSKTTSLYVLVSCYRCTSHERIPAQLILGGSSQLGYVVNNHGDRKSPIPGVVGLLPNGPTSWLIHGGDPNHLLTGMILQVWTNIHMNSWDFQPISTGDSPWNGGHFQMLVIYPSTAINIAKNSGVTQVIFEGWNSRSYVVWHMFATFCHTNSILYINTYAKSYQ